MGGIVRIVNTDPPVDENIVIRRRDSSPRRVAGGEVAHRGPDDGGLYLSPDRKVALGNRHLAIIDLSPAGHQPLGNEDGTVWISYNGEIYNFEELHPR